MADSGSPSFRYGDIVTIRGLTSARGKLLNRKTATVVVFPNHEGRAVLHVAHRESVVAVKPENIEKKFPGYEVRPSGVAEGLGIFATRDFNAGETIIAERPLVTEDRANARELTNADHQVLKQLSPFNEAATNVNAEDATPLTPSQLVRICQTNEFAHAGVCPVMSRANHSCAARAQFEWDAAEEVELLYAIAPIAAGEEIFVTYTPDFATTAERQSVLRVTKSFVCRCPHCALPSDEVAARDQKLEQLRQLHQSLPQLAYNPCEFLRTAERAVALCEDLGATERALVPAIALEALQLCLAHRVDDTVLDAWAKRASDTLDRRAATQHWRRQRRGVEQFRAGTGPQRKSHLARLFARQ